LENSAGNVVTAPRQLRSKNKPRIPKSLTESIAPSDALISAAIKALRAGDKASTSSTSLANIPRTSANETLAILRKVVAAAETVTIGYADTNGSVTQRIIDPVSITMGNLVARDHSSEEVATFKIARITGVAPF
jgi:predicted DNA-binding transcriptional regulator YafY